MLADKALQIHRQNIIWIVCFQAIGLRNLPNCPQKILWKFSRLQRDDEIR
jgi:hypothetical protein